MWRRDPAVAAAHSTCGCRPPKRRHHNSNNVMDYRFVRS
jgi:hypothetical protein